MTIWDSELWMEEALTFREGFLVSEGIEITVSAALNLVAARWLRAGDLRPLAYVLSEGMALPALQKLAGELISSGRIVVAHSGGRPVSPSKPFRDALLSWAYEHSGDEKSDAAILDLAEQAGLKPDVVRKAIANERKKQRK